MTDTITVRDHSQPCEHGHLFFHPWYDTNDGPLVKCPGGREIVLRRPTDDDGIRRQDTWWVEVGNDN